jgi:hypothetical protein
MNRSMINVPMVLMKLKPLGKRIVILTAPKPSEIILTKEGENDPCIPPAILIDHVQWRYIFFADLFSLLDQSYFVLAQTSRSQACLVLAISTSLGVARVFQIPSECVHEVVSPSGTGKSKWGVENSELARCAAYLQTTKTSQVNL